MRALGLDDAIERLRDKHGGVVKLDVATYINASSPARFIDLEHGEWWIQPCKVLAGAKHPRRSGRWKRMPEDEFIEKLASVHGANVMLVPGTYSMLCSSAQFIDIEHGIWTALAGNILKGQRHPEGRLKRIASTMRSHGDVVHWISGETLHPASSYERATLLWLAHHKIDFSWQVPFETPVLTSRGRRAVYHVDLYIKNGQFADTFIEIKGTWHNASRRKAKWEWFHTTHPNSRLWMERELIELGVGRKDGRGRIISPYEIG